jgi:hypothetical protein
MNDRDVVLGMECALPKARTAPQARGRWGRFVHWLIAALRRWG